MVKFRRVTARVVLGVGCALGCGNGTDPANTISGQWSVQYVDDQTLCPADDVVTSNFTSTITQTGASFAITFNDVEYEGTLSADLGEWSGTYAENGGTKTEMFQVRFSNDNTLMLGGSTYDWTDDVTSCMGSTSITGIRAN